MLPAALATAGVALVAAPAVAAADSSGEVPGSSCCLSFCDRMLSSSAARPAVPEHAAPTSNVALSPMSSIRKMPEIRAPKMAPKVLAV